ncbi:MAG: acyl carrier protein [Desulfovibrionales bacterium]|nr:acyl carrier protein [Desulfovibrionales bacterium]
MSTFDQVRNIICEVLEAEPTEVTPTTFVMRDLPTESIDLMEYGVGLTKDCGVTVQDDTVFLKSMRLHIAQATEDNRNVAEHLHSVYPHLTLGRIDEMVATIAEGPVLQVQDIAAYIDHAQQHKA